MRVESPIADEVAFDKDGIHLDWGDECLEARYVGPFLGWNEVRDVDVDAAPPEVRMRDGRTVFISAMSRDRLEEAALGAGITFVRRAPVWPHLLEPFLDTDYSIFRERYEADLRRWGFTEREVRRIRRRFAVPMFLMTVVTAEWVHYGQADLLYARFTLKRAPWQKYLRFRRWTDEIADRPTRLQGGVS